jgi:hypothetical protein
MKGMSDANSVSQASKATGKGFYPKAKAPGRYALENTQLFTIVRYNDCRRSRRVEGCDGKHPSRGS